AGVVLDVGAEGELFPAFAVNAGLVNVALDRLKENLLAVFGPRGGAASFFGFERNRFLAVEAEDEDADLAQVAAGDGEALAVGAEGGDAATLPVLGGDESFVARGEVADEGLIVLDENDRLAVGGPVALR